MKPEEMAKVGSVELGIDVLTQKITELQQSNLSDRQLCGELRSELHAALDEKKRLLDNRADISKDKLKSLQDTFSEQSSLIRRFKRKLLLVSKERDSYKGLIDSYEHELTFSGSQFEKDRISSIEKVLADYKETVEQLEEAIGPNKSGTMLASSKAKENELEAKNVELEAQIQRLDSLYAKAMAEKEDLELELERRAIRGDYKPSDTKVLHFRQVVTFLIIIAQRCF